MDEVREIYSNAVNVISTLYEVTLKFGLSILDEKDGKLHTHTVANVRLSPQQAMALSILLERHLTGYGEQWKEIFLPEELKQRLAGAVDEGTKHET